MKRFFCIGWSQLPLLLYASIYISLFLGAMMLLQLEGMFRFGSQCPSIYFYYYHTFIAACILLPGIIEINQVHNWDTSQGALYTLSQLPMQPWSSNLLLLSLLFLLLFLLPPLLLARQGIRPTEERLPMQTRLLIFPAQFIANFVWLGILYVLYSSDWTNEILLIGTLGVCKSIFEALVYLHLDWHSF